MGWGRTSVRAGPAVTHGLRGVRLAPVGRRPVAVPPPGRAGDAAGGVRARRCAMSPRGTRRPTTTTVRCVRRRVDLTPVREDSIAVRPSRAAGDSTYGTDARGSAMSPCGAGVSTGRAMRWIRSDVGLAPRDGIPIAIAHRRRTRELADGIDACLLAHACLRAHPTVVIVAGEVDLAPIRRVSVAVIPSRVAKQRASPRHALGRRVRSPWTGVSALAAVGGIRRRRYLAAVGPVVVAITPTKVTVDRAGRIDAVRGAVVCAASVAAGPAMGHGRRGVRLAPSGGILVAVPGPRAAR